MCSPLPRVLFASLLALFLSFSLGCNFWTDVAPPMDMDVEDDAGHQDDDAGHQDDDAGHEEDVGPDADAGDDDVEDDVEIPPLPGTITIVIDGLDEVDADVHIQGPDFDEVITETTTFDDLVPGQYSITASPVDHQGLSLFMPQPQAQNVDLDEDASETVEISYELVPAEVNVIIDGLPTAAASVQLLDESEDEVVLLTSSQYLYDLLPGSYEFRVMTVEEPNGIVYDAASVFVDLSSGTNDEIAISYAPVTANLMVQVEGLPLGAAADLQISGPNFDEQSAGQEFFDKLEPGLYEITPEPVDHLENTYVAPSQSITLEAGDDEEILVTYEVVGGEISVAVQVFDGIDFDVRLVGPGDFDEAISGDIMFDDAPVGSYSVVVDFVESDNLGNSGYVRATPTTFDINSSDLVQVDIVVAPGTLVTTEEDDLPGSLRSVLTSVVDTSTVEFADDIALIELSSGQIQVEGSIDVVGRDDAALIIDAQAQSRIFFVSEDSHLSLQGITLRNGEDLDGGAIFVDTGAELVVTRSLFKDHHATADGGAIFVENGATLYALETIFDDNTSEENGGAIAVRQTSNSEALMEITACLFKNNRSFTEGGALYTDGDARIYDSTFVDNQSTALGGAIRVWDGDAIILGATITGNQAFEGGGIHFTGNETNRLYLGRSIVAGNTGDPGPDIGRQTTTREVDSLGYNVIGVEAPGLEEGVMGDQVGTETAPLDALLSDLAEHGGFSMMMAPEADSPAGLSVPAAACEEMGELVLPLRDQRRARRPAGAFCSAGAYEFDATTETFANANMSAASYQTGSFVGEDGITWSYFDTRRDTQGFVIEERSIIFQTATGSIISEPIAGGISSLSLQMSKAFFASADRQIEVRINGDVVGTSPAFDDSTQPYPVYRFAVEDIDVDGDFTIEIRNLGAQIVIDNLTWQ